MDVKELNNINKDWYVRIGNTSITVKDEYSKTKNVITNVTRIDNLQFNKKLDMLNYITKNYGLTRQLIMQLKDNIIIDGKDIYYLCDIKKLQYWLDMINEYDNKEGYDVRDIKEYVKKVFDILDICKQHNIPIINVHIKWN